MDLVTLMCPHCKFTKRLDKSSLPPEKTNAKCPKCKGNFLLDYSLHLQAAVPENQPPETLCNPDAAVQTVATPNNISDYVVANQSKTDTAVKKFQTLSFTFTGNSKEYFGIWIVNTLLRIITLGIYSPWAKVRKRRYFSETPSLTQPPSISTRNHWPYSRGGLLPVSFSRFTPLPHAPARLPHSQ
jgi:glutaredoxin